MKWQVFYAMILQYWAILGKRQPGPMRLNLVCIMNQVHGLMVWTIDLWFSAIQLCYDCPGCQLDIRKRSIWATFFLHVTYICSTTMIWHMMWYWISIHWHAAHPCFFCSLFQHMFNAATEHASLQSDMLDSDVHVPACIL